MVRRLSNELDNKSLKKMADSFYISKLRYVLSLFGKIRWNSNEPSHKEFEDLQVNQNKLLRFLNNTRISDKISTESLLQKHNILSVNQLNAQSKINDIWKATHLDNYPTKVTTLNSIVNSANTRAKASGNLVELGQTTIMQSTFINDATKAWNMVPSSIKTEENQLKAKRLIKEFVKTLPI